MPVPSDNLTDITNRPNYYAGQYLLEDDFELEQRYHLDRLRRHHRLLHIAGIVDGLEVSWADSPANTKLKVTAGTAIDAAGRQIVLDQIRSDIVIPDMIATTDGTLFIRYESSEDTTQGPPNQPGANAASNPMDGKNLIKERPVIECGTSVPTGAIVLAKVNTTQGLDFSDRVYSGLRLPSPRNTPGQGLTLRYKGSGQVPAATQLELAEFTGNLSITGTLAVTGTSTLTGKVSVGGTLAVTGASTLTGNAALNGALTVAGTSTLTNAMLTGELNFGYSTRQMINLFGTEFGIGIQDSTQYFRTSKNFAWYKGGIHSKTELDVSTSGTVQMVIRDGNVGIGTTTPGAKLEVSGTTGIVLKVGVPATRGEKSTADIHLAGHIRLIECGSDQTAYLQARDDDSNRNITLQLRSQLQGETKPTAVDNMRLSPNGQVGFGPISPVNDEMIRLDVLGGIRIRNHGNKNQWIDFFCDASNVGIGTTTPAAKLDVAGGLQLRNGGPAGLGSNQIVLGKADASISHVIKTRHSTGYGGGNAIDFYLWDPVIDRDQQDEKKVKNPIGTRQTMTLEAGGNTGNLRVFGSITEQLPVISLKKGEPDWEKTESSVRAFFKKELDGKPPGTMIKAINDGSNQKDHCFIGWVTADGKIFCAAIAGGHEAT